jgi:molybdate transport system regulatory protein
MLQIKYKIWLDNEGSAFGKGPYELLMGVKKNGSLSLSAKGMGMSYNKAHNLIKQIEERLGFNLLVSKVGGSKGGGSSLTEEAEKLMETYEDFILECDHCLQGIFDRYFKNDD